MSARTVIGPVVGLSYANIKTVTSAKAPATLPGIKAGIHIEQKLSNNFYLQPGLFYSVYGFRITNPAVTYRYDMAEIPLYLLLKTGIPCKPRLVVGAGLIAAVAVNRSNANENALSMPAPGFAGYAKLSSGMGVSLGIEMPRGLFLSVAYQRLFNERTNAQVAAPKLYQFGITMGYLINKLNRR